VKNVNKIPFLLVAFYHSSNYNHSVLLIEYDLVNCSNGLNGKQKKWGKLMMVIACEIFSGYHAFKQYQMHRQISQEGRMNLIGAEWMEVFEKKSGRIAELLLVLVGVCVLVNNEYA